MLANLVIIAIVSVVVHLLLRRDFEKGLAAAVFFLVLLPVEVRLDTPGALPPLTGERIILLIVAFHSLKLDWKQALQPVSRIVVLLFLVALCHLASTFTAIDPWLNLKDWLGFLIETLLYFVMIAVGLRTRRGMELMAWGALSALLVVAVIATIEKYTGRNLAAMIVPGMLDFPNSITATFRHRILLGYAMAMGFPLALVLDDFAPSNRMRWVVRASLVLLPAACYFSDSRGPWVGCALGGVVMVVLGGRAIRKKLALVGVAAVLVLVLRPGVLGTVTSLWHQTFNQDTIKGRSADYRTKLWSVAYQELDKSFGYTLLGYGGHSTEILDLGYYFSRGSGGNADVLGYTSWDSQFAADFMQFGYLGFGLEALLFLLIIGMVYRSWKLSNPPDNMFLGACMATVLVFMWAMSTVSIFNPQLEFLFWALVGIAGRFHAIVPSVAVSEEQDAESPGTMHEEAAEGDVGWAENAR